MALDAYKAYRRSLSKRPVEQWQALMQASVNDTWNDTSTVTTVQGQDLLGGTEYSDESVQVNSVIDPKTGSALGDQFRKIIYKTYKESLINSDLTQTKRFLGKYYVFDNFYWLTINTNTNIGALATAILQKCNNTLKWYDKKGVFHQWPCVFERTLNATSFDLGSQGVSEVSANSLIKVQLNDETAEIEYNQRFILNGHAFQVKQINNHISETYLELYIFEIQVQSNDDLVDNVANVTNSITPKKNETAILPKINKINQGKTQAFTVYKYVNGVATDASYNISLSGPVAGVNYTAVIIDGNNFTVKNDLQSDTPLLITCSNTQELGDVVTMSVLLTGGW